MFSSRLAIDLGTTRTRIMMPGKDLVLDQPSIVAREVNSKKVNAVGDEAISMVGRTAQTIDAYHPLKNGVIADFRTTERMLAHFIAKSAGKLKLRAPTAVITVSSAATPTEKRAVLDVAKSAGIREVKVIKAPIAAALGAGIPILEARGNMIIDLGGGSTEVAVLSLGGVAAENSIRIGGDDIDHAINEYLRKNYSITVGEQSSTEIKHLIGSAMPSDNRSEARVHGRDLIGGLPKQITVEANELVPSIELLLEQIVLAVRGAMEITPPEIVSDIINQGIILTGGGSRLTRIDTLLSKVIGVPVLTIKDPELCAVKGALLALSDIENYHQSLLVGN